MKTLFLFLFFFAINSLATEPKSIVVAIEKLQYHPLYYIENGEFKGFARDILDQFFQKKNYSVQYKVLPYLRANKELKEKQVDLMFPDNPLWINDKKSGESFIYSKPIISYTDGLFSLKGHRLKEKDDIKVVGTLFGFTVTPLKERVDSGLVQLKEVFDVEKLLELLYLGRVDAIFLNTSVGLFYDREVSKKKQLELLPIVKHVESDYCFSSISRSDLVLELNEFFKRPIRLGDQVEKKK